MAEFFKKNGKVVAVSVLVIACISFLVYIAALGSGYYASVEGQAVSRADDYAYEQAAYVSAKLEAVKTAAEFYASDASSKKTEEDFFNALSSIRSHATEKDRNFKDIYYSFKGKIYTARGDEYSAPSEMTSLLDSPETTVSKTFLTKTPLWRSQSLPTRNVLSPTKY